MKINHRVGGFVSLVTVHSAKKMVSECYNNRNASLCAQYTIIKMGSSLIMRLRYKNQRHASCSRTISTILPKRFQLTDITNLVTNHTEIFIFRRVFVCVNTDQAWCIANIKSNNNNFDATYNFLLFFIHLCLPTCMTVITNLHRIFEIVIISE